MDKKFIWGIITIVVVILFIWVARNPSGNDNAYDELQKMHDLELKKKDMKYDSLQDENEMLVIHYRRILTARDRMSIQNKDLEDENKYLKRIKPTNYNSRQIDSICLALYGPIPKND